jgi:hypothetical protein
MILLIMEQILKVLWKNTKKKKLTKLVALGKGNGKGFSLHWLNFEPM